MHESRTPSRFTEGRLRISRRRIAAGAAPCAPCLRSSGYRAGAKGPPSKVFAEYARSHNFRDWSFCFTNRSLRSTHASALLLRHHPTLSADER